MSEKTATVEVLTAEVRVLMVGSRQVTLSVYRQLDTVEPGGITPFGRVRDPREDHDEKLYVVGADTGGRLVRAKVWVGQRVPEGEHDWDVWESPHYKSLRGRWGSEGEYLAHVKEQREVHDRWRDLPLIVLAGLT